MLRHKKEEMPLLDLWVLPQKTVIQGVAYALHTDYRDILEIIACLNNPDLPVLFRWQIALALFYEPIPPAAHRKAAMEYLAEFIGCGSASDNAPPLISWQQDAGAIIADINQVSGKEIRREPYIHWWTFLAWFHSIGQGQLSGLVAIRSKLRRGEKLDEAEQAFFRSHRKQVLLQSESLQQQEEKRRLEQRLKEVN